MVTATNEPRFSLERFESIMMITKFTWDEINKELDFNVERMFKDTTKPPMANVVGKACTVIGLDSPDYVMMKSNDFNLKEIKPEPLDSNKKKRKPYTKITDEIIEEIRELTKTKSAKEVSKILNCSATIVYKYMDRDNKQNKYLTKEEKLKIKELSKTKTIKELAQIFNTTTTTIYKYIDKDNYKFNKKIITDEEKRKIYKLSKTKTNKEIAKITGYNVNAISSYTQRAKNKITKDITEQIKEEEKIKSDEQVEKMFNLTTSTVNRVVDNNIEEFKNKATIDNNLIKKIVELKDHDKKTYPEIAEMFGLNKRTIGKYYRMAKFNQNMDGVNMEIPANIKEAIAATETVETNTTVEKNNTTISNSNNYRPEQNSRYNNNDISLRDILNRIDYMSDDDISAIEEYIVAIKNVRAIKNKFK